MGFVACRFGGLPKTEIINGVLVVRFIPSGEMVGSLLNRWLLLRGGSQTIGMTLGRSYTWDEVIDRREKLDRSYTNRD